MKNVAKESRQKGNKIFASLLEEANKANERQAGKIVGKILAEAKENKEKAESEVSETNKASIPSGRYLPSRNMNIEEIVNKTCEYFGLTREELMSNTRRRDVALPRQVAIYACRYLTELTLSAIGIYFHKKHSTVLYACNTVEALMDVDKRVAAAVETICNDL